MWVHHTHCKRILVLANETEKALTLVNTEMAAIRQAVLQNRMALDLLLAKEGGVCKVLNTSCCFSLPDYYRNMSDLIAHMRASIQIKGGKCHGNVFNSVEICLLSYYAQ
uniref:ERVV2 protein n=1 Tax=Pygocentrus nattereri TaxID=42514 RepID=A0A3B4DT81_PYGNA